MNKEVNEEVKNFQKKKDIIKKITVLFNCSKYCDNFDEVILQQNNNPEILKPVFDDYKIFIKDDDKSINVISYLYKKNLLSKTHPFLIYFLVKYRNCCQSLFNSLKKNDIDQLFMENIDYIPAWVLILRFISSSHIILYDDDNNNILKSKIEEKMEDKITSLTKEKREINTDWINLMLDKIPSELLNNNIHIFYEYFKNLVGKLKISNNRIKDKIKDILEEFYSILIENVFNGDINNFIKQNFSYEYNDKDELMINIVKKPNKYIFNKIKQKCNEKQLNFANHFQTLYDNNIIKFISNLPEIKDKIYKSYEEINANKLEIYKTSQDNKKNDEINSKYDSILKEIKNFNDKIDDLIINSSNIQIENTKINNLLEELSKIKKKYKGINDSDEFFEYFKITFKRNDKIKKVFFNEEEFKLFSEYI